MDPDSQCVAGLNPAYTFETLVVGPWNRLACEAARAVAERPGGRLNPLYFYGVSGLGKTHLAQAIAQALQVGHQSLRVIYISGRRFIEEYTTALSGHQVPEFRVRFRQECDVLIVDDIEALSGMERGQIEFCEIFNALCDNGRQIVMTSGKRPSELSGIDPRLTSRFGQGLVADLELPEFDARLALVRRKAELQGVELPEEVMNFIATEFFGSVRGLEGALRRVVSSAQTLSEPITPVLAYGFLAALLARRQELLSAEAVQRAVASYFRIEVIEMRGPSRYRRISVPRQIAMYLTRKLCHLSYPEIGQRFGGKDHSSVITACRKTEQRIATDAVVRGAVQHLEQVLQRQAEAVGTEDEQAA